MRARKDPRVRQVSCSLAGEWQVVEIMRPGGEIYRDVRPLVRHQHLGRGRRGRPPGERLLRRRRAARLHRLHRARLLAGRRGRGAEKRAGQSRVRAGAGRRDDGGARPGLAGHPAARGGRPRARGRLQPQEDIRLRRPAGPAGRLAGRDGGGRRHHRRTPRLAVDRRRGHADLAHRADRGRHPEGLHAGPA